MAYILIKLNPKKLSNPDANLRHFVPEIIEELTNGEIINSGYDYLCDENDTMVIYLESKNPKEDILIIRDIFKTNNFLKNDLYNHSIIEIVS